MEGIGGYGGRSKIGHASWGLALDPKDPRPLGTWTPRAKDPGTLGTSTPRGVTDFRSHPLPRPPGDLGPKDPEGAVHPASLLPLCRIPGTPQGWLHLFAMQWRQRSRTSCNARPISPSSCACNALQTFSRLKLDGYCFQPLKFEWQRSKVKL
jgi:hypothetical protein